MYQLVICIVNCVLNSMIDTINHNMFYNVKSFSNMLILPKKVVIQNYLRDRCEISQRKPPTNSRSGTLQVQVQNKNEK